MLRVRLLPKDFAGLVGTYLGAAPPRAVMGTALGGAAAVLSVLLRFSATPYIGDGEALLTAFPLVLLASLVAGQWGGWTCLVLCTVASWYLFIGDAFTFSFGPYEKGILIGTFLAGAFVIQITVMLRHSFGEISELRTSEQLLARELQHRMKNTLTLVLSIARQTFRADRPRDAALADFENRLIALGAAQEMTHGRSEPTSIADIVERSLLPFCGEALHERLEIHGPHIVVGESMAVGLFLMFHELATNAAKYGALSAHGGRVSINWTREAPGPLVLRWTERGGPTVERPTREGFGTKLINRMMVRTLKGSITIAYPPAGLDAVLSAPIRDQQEAVFSAAGSGEPRAAR